MSWDLDGDTLVLDSATVVVDSATVVLDSVTLVLDLVTVVLEWEPLVCVVVASLLLDCEMRDLELVICAICARREREEEESLD